MALTNHNYLGYCLQLIVKHRVRWIEAAAVCPAFTGLICFYMEEDRGHVMNEELCAAKHRIGVRGNVFSFPMPWTDIMSSLLQAGNSSELTVPHPPEILAHLVRLHLKVDNMDLTRHMKEICVRTRVLLELGYSLIERGHPALMKRTSAGPVYRAEVARIKQAYEARVRSLYPMPDSEEERERGVPPAAVWAVCVESNKGKHGPSPLHEKNATPPPGVLSHTDVFDAMQPQMVVAERDTSAGANTAEIGQAALSRYGELEVRTGNDFVPQWTPSYLSEVFCFDFKHQTGGPEFYRSDSLRAEGSSFVDMFDYTAGIPRRVERHMRASWMIVPALRNLCFRRQILEASNIMSDLGLSEMSVSVGCVVARLGLAEVRNLWLQISN